MPLDGAYLECVVVNLMGGVGETEVFLDDLAISPVPQADRGGMVEGPSDPPRNRPPAARAEPARKDGDSTLPPIRLTRNLLEKLRPDRRYVGWFPTAIDAPGADLARLRGAGCDVLVTVAIPNPREAHAAVEGGFFLLPRLRWHRAEHRRCSIRWRPIPSRRP